METTTNVDAVVQRYLDAWNEADGARRETLIAETWEATGTYTDPLFNVAGAGEIDALIGGFQQQYPGLTFVRTGEVEAHHHLCRFTWDLCTPAGDVIAKGMDVGLIGDSGRLQAIHGFFDQAPVLG